MSRMSRQKSCPSLSRADSRRSDTVTISAPLTRAPPRRGSPARDIATCRASGANAGDAVEGEVRGCHCVGPSATKGPPGPALPVHGERVQARGLAGQRERWQPAEALLRHAAWRSIAPAPHPGPLPASGLRDARHLSSPRNPRCAVRMRACLPPCGGGFEEGGRAEFRKPGLFATPLIMRGPRDPPS